MVKALTRSVESGVATTMRLLRIYARRFIVFAFLLVAVVGCATAPVVPRVEDSGGSGIGIDVQLRFPISFFLTYDADVVYFARSCEVSEHCDKKLYASNYATDGRVYLLNAAPGVYEAVAAAYAWAGVAYIAYFPEDLIRQTRVRVEKGQFAYAGTYVIKLSLGLCQGKADETQLLYAEKMQPGTPKCKLTESMVNKLAKARYVFVGVGFLPYGYANEYRASAVTASRDDAHERAFLEKAKVDLASGGWRISMK